ncbi:MAG TPA: hypothetical protein VMT69_09750, partial [Kineosporiaceae bacterium]|nr:hypothetical protein [Kineosporiaceae bacterium]
MGKHLRTGSARRVRVMGAVAALAATGITASVALTHADATTSNRTAPVADLDRTRTFACPGTLLLLTRAGASALRLTCVNGVSPVGRDTVTAVRSGAVARTGLPAGTARGTLLVTMVQSPATSAVSVPGWTRAYDQVSGPRGVRLSTWYRVATGGETEARADVTPAARASMLTTALAGARASAPVAFAAAAGGLRAPSAAAAVDGGRWLLGLGAEAAGVRARIDGPGASPARVVRNGDTRTAQAMAATPRGVVPATTWTARGVRQAVSGLLVVAPRPPAAVPSGSVAVVAGRTADAT